MSTRQVVPYLFPVGMCTKSFRDRVTKRQLQSILLDDINDCRFWNGGCYAIKFKHLGVGVYEIWFEEKNL